MELGWERRMYTELYELFGGQFIVHFAKARRLQ